MAIAVLSEKKALRNLLLSARRYVADERDMLAHSYCCLENGVPDISTMDDAGKPLYRRQLALIKRLDRALSQIKPEVRGSRR